MRQMTWSALACIAFASCGTALAGIEIGTPLVSADVTILENNHQTTQRELSPAQLHALSAWLSRHLAGWQGLVAPASDELQPLQFSLNDAAGNRGTIAVVPGPSSGVSLRYISASGRWSYRSSGGLFKSWAAGLELSSEDLRQLQLIAGLPNNP